MKHGKPQKKLGVHDVDLSDLSRRVGRMEMMFGDYGGSHVYRTRNKETLKNTPLSLCYHMNRGRQKSTHVVRKVTASLFC
jgi:hypothetical protein